LNIIRKVVIDPRGLKRPPHAPKWDNNKKGRKRALTIAKIRNFYRDPVHGLEAT
jgi:hypothetical protein